MRVRSRLISLAVCAAFAFADVEIVIHADRALAQENKGNEEKPKFDSPFNGTRDLNGEEGKDFTKLMDAYDTMKDAEADLESAKACKSGVEKAQKAYDDAKAAFDKLIDQYVIDWSSLLNAQKLRRNGATWLGEIKKVMDALEKQDKKQHGGKKCSEKGAVKIHNRHKCREDEPCFMEGFQPREQPSTTTTTTQPTDSGPVYVPAQEPDDRNGRPYKPHVPEMPNGDHNPYSPMGAPNYP